MKAKLESGIYNLYDNKGELIGAVKPSADFKKSEISTDNKRYNVSREKSAIQVVENDKVVFNLNHYLLSGQTEIVETGNKLKGIMSFKGGTQMIDKSGNRLVKIQNENVFFNNNVLDVQIENDQVNHLDTLLTLNAHLQGSLAKNKAAIFIGAIISVIIYIVLGL